MPSPSTHGCCSNSGSPNCCQTTVVWKDQSQIRKAFLLALLVTGELSIGKTQIWQKASFARLAGKRVNNPGLPAASLMVEFCRWKGGSASPCIASSGTHKCSLDLVVFSASSPEGQTMISLSGYFSNHHLVPGKGEGYRGGGMDGVEAWDWWRDTFTPKLS